MSKSSATTTPLPGGESRYRLVTQTADYDRAQWLANQERRRLDPDQFDPDQFDPDQFDPDQFDPDQFDPDQFDPDQF